MLDVTQNRWFWDKTSPTSSGCIEWRHALTTSGYGHLSIHGRLKAAHRIAYELTVGPIPSGMVLDHLCRNRRCVRPQHLEVVTQRTNILRGVGSAAMNARKTKCPRGHPLATPNLRITADGKRRCRTCYPNGNNLARQFRRGDS